MFFFLLVRVDLSKLEIIDKEYYAFRREVSSRAKWQTRDDFAKILYINEEIKRFDEFLYTNQYYVVHRLERRVGRNYFFPILRLF